MQIIEKFHLTKLTYTNEEKVQIKLGSQSWLSKDTYKMQQAWFTYVSLTNIILFAAVKQLLTCNKKIKIRIRLKILLKSVPLNLKLDPEWKEKNYKLSIPWHRSSIYISTLLNCFFQN